MADESDTKIWPLFVAGVVTAAGAATFWGIVSLFKRKRQEEAEADDLDLYLLSAEASAVEGE